jgi:hypothetical protein
MRASFPRLLLSEWTKLRSVSRWVITLVAAIALTVGLSYLIASANRTDINEHGQFASGPLGGPVAGDFYFVHQTVTGDATLTVRVASLTTDPVRAELVGNGGERTLVKLDDPSPFAQPAAGIMIKDGTSRGSSYASVLLTPSQGVRMQWDYEKDRGGSATAGARWLRLVRSGGTVTGYESADGAAWHEIGTATPANLPSTAEIGFYVSAPPVTYAGRGGASSTRADVPRYAEAVFDNVQLGSGGAWHAEFVGRALASDKGALAGDKSERPRGGEMTETGGTFTVTGSGKVGPDAPEDDMVETALFGIIAGLMALIAVGVLYGTSEYRRGMIRTTFAATPRRGRVLAAKAIVLGTTSFLVGLAGTVVSFLLAIPLLRTHGFTAPGFPRPSLMDPSVLRAILLSAAFMAGVAVVGLGLGVLLRHSAAAITITIVLVLLPLIFGMILPGTSPKWLMYTTLAGGLATQRVKPPTMSLAEPWALIGPWGGIGAVAAWVVVVLGLAWWRLRRRDA